MWWIVRVEGWGSTVWECILYLRVYSRVIVGRIDRLGLLMMYCADIGVGVTSGGPWVEVRTM